MSKKKEVNETPVEEIEVSEVAIEAPVEEKAEPEVKNEKKSEKKVKKGPARL